jgi:hypothetical protein
MVCKSVPANPTEKRLLLWEIGLPLMSKRILGSVYACPVRLVKTYVLALRSGRIKGPQRPYKTV